MGGLAPAAGDPPPLGVDCDGLVLRPAGRRAPVGVLCGSHPTGARLRMRSLVHDPGAAAARQIRLPPRRVYRANNQTAIHMHVCKLTSGICYLRPERWIAPLWDIKPKLLSRTTRDCIVVRRTKPRFDLQAKSQLMMPNFSSWFAPAPPVTPERVKVLEL